MTHTEQTHPCDRCGTPTPESQLRLLPIKENDDEFGCPKCYGIAEFRVKNAARARTFRHPVTT